MVYDNIKHLCREKNISIRSLESKSGFGSGTISKWNKSSPSAEKLSTVAKLLDVPIDTLLR